MCACVCVRVYGGGHPGVCACVVVVACGVGALSAQSSSPPAPAQCRVFMVETLWIIFPPRTLPSPGSLCVRSGFGAEAKSPSGGELAFSVPSGGDGVPRPTPISEGDCGSQARSVWPVLSAPAREGVRWGEMGGCQLGRGRLGSSPDPDGGTLLNPFSVPQPSSAREALLSPFCRCGN